MAEEIPQWAEDRALELARLDGAGRGQGRYDGHYYADMHKAFARYIAEHEEPPVDPLLIEARKLASELSKDAGSFDFISGRFDDWYAVRAALAALRRGMELAREQSK
jgi:hypothetical protein